jgi:hypothetical protein
MDVSQNTRLHGNLQKHVYVHTQKESVMYFWSSSETNGAALDYLWPVSKAVNDLLTVALATGDLGDFDIKIRYIPIIMTLDRRYAYPARSRAEQKKRIYNCCPQLDYEAFVNGTPAQRIAIYLDGLKDCSTGLKKLGATPQQIATFEKIVQEVKEKLMAEATQDPA